MAAVEYTARAMASEVRLVVVDGPSDAVDVALARIAHLETCWSRFSPTSDITRLNRAGGCEVEVDADTVVLVAALVEAWRDTGGRFDPTVLPDLVTAGYDRSVVDGSPAPELPPTARGGGDLHAVAIDPVASTVALPLGMALDPGGLGKGLAADLLADELHARGAAGVLVGVGGDVAVRGCSPRGGRWAVSVEDPMAPGSVTATLWIDHGGVATSSVVSRRWEGAGGPRHHLIDPTTGAPAATDLLAATVVAPTAWQAEATATEALLGPTAAAALLALDAAGRDGVVVDREGRLHTSSALLTPDRRPA